MFNCKTSRHGTFYWPDGDFYEGEWVQGARFGDGKYYCNIEGDYGIYKQTWAETTFDYYARGLKNERIGKRKFDNDSGSLSWTEIPDEVKQKLKSPSKSVACESMMEDPQTPNSRTTAINILAPTTPTTPTAPTGPIPVAQTSSRNLQFTTSSENANRTPTSLRVATETTMTLPQLPSTGLVPLITRLPTVFASAARVLTPQQSQPTLEQAQSDNETHETEKTQETENTEEENPSKKRKPNDK